MKNLLKISVIATAMLVGVLTYSMSPTLAAYAPSGAVLAESNVSPRSLYTANCARCHGADGRSNTPKGRETDADDISGGLSAAKITRIVKSGKGDMPGFGKRLTAAQISQIASYVRTL